MQPMQDIAVGCLIRRRLASRRRPGTGATSKPRRGAENTGGWAGVVGFLAAESQRARIWRTMRFLWKMAGGAGRRMHGWMFD